MAEFRTIPLRPMTGVFDSLSSPDEIGFGNFKVVKNATTRSTRNRQRAGGWRRLFADEDPFNNFDLHDQLVDRLDFYDSYVAHSQMGGDQVGYSYTYFQPPYHTEGNQQFPPAKGPYGPVYVYDVDGFYNGCPVFYPYVGIPYNYVRAPYTGHPELTTGYPNYYLFSYVYTSCPVTYGAGNYPGYPYGPGLGLYEPLMAYDYDYCGALHYLQGCREAITMLQEIVTASGRKLIASTMSRVYELNQSTGNWRILADGLGNSGYTSAQCTCNSVRGTSATIGGYLIYTNGFDAPGIYFLGDDCATCDLQSMQVLADLLEIGVTRAGGVVTWKGFTIFYDFTQDSERMGGSVMWSDLDNPLSFIESDTSFAGSATVAVGDTILAAAPLGNWLFLYTDKAIIRVSLVGGEDVFKFEEVYRGGNALKYKYSLTNCGDQHLYLGESDVYVFSQFDNRPINISWITKAAGMIFNGITEDNATYDPINMDACNLVTGGWSEETHEAFLSWPTGDNVCPNVTLRFNIKFGAADFIDHGFTAFLTFRADPRPTIGSWLEDLGVCARGTLIGMGCKEGHVCPGTADAVANPPLYIFNETENPALPFHPRSLCAALQGKTLADFCEDCPTRTTFIAASASDFCLKQIEDDIYYRERLAFLGGPCRTVTFVTAQGSDNGILGDALVLDEWLDLGNPVGNCIVEEVNLGSGAHDQIDYGTITPDIHGPTPGPITYFNSGNDLPPGRYRISYVNGAMQHSVNPITPWAVNSSTPPGAGYHGVFDDGAYTFFMNATQSLFASQALCEAANVGKFYDITHLNGKIGMYFEDYIGYGDNLDGSPSPTFRLTKI